MAVLLPACAGTASGTSSLPGPASGSLSPTPSPSFPAPVLESLSQPIHYAPTNVTFSPPSDPTPRIDEVDAVTNAEQDMGDVHPAEVAATYVDFSGGGEAPRPYWIISFVGGDICNVVSTVPGAPPPSNDCAGNVTDVALNADTGAFVGIYSNGSAADNEVPPSEKTEADLLIGS